MTASSLDSSFASPDSPADVLLLHASRFGQSVAIAEALAADLRTAGWRCTQARVQDVAASTNLARYRAVVIVASIRYGHFDRAVHALIAARAAELAATMGVFVSVNLTARKPDKRTPQTNAYTRKFLAFAEQRGWRPALCEVVAGALRYPRYGFFDKRMIQFIMKLTGGETDTAREVEYTDWDQVRSLAHRLGERLAQDDSRR